MRKLAPSGKKVRARGFCTELRRSSKIFEECFLESLIQAPNAATDFIFVFVHWGNSYSLGNKTGKNYFGSIAQDINKTKRLIDTIASYNGYGQKMAYSNAPNLEMKKRKKSQNKPSDFQAFKNLT